MSGLLVFWAICAAAAWFIGGYFKDRPKAGFLCGALLGLLGVVVIAFMRSASELDHQGAHYIDAPRGPRKLFGESEASFQDRVDAERS